MAFIANAYPKFLECKQMNGEHPNLILLCLWSNKMRHLWTAYFAKMTQYFYYKILILMSNGWDPPIYFLNIKLKVAHTTCPDLSVFQMKSLRCSSVTSPPRDSLSLVTHTSTSCNQQICFFLIRKYLSFNIVLLSVFS